MRCAADASDTRAFRLWKMLFVRGSANGLFCPPKPAITQNHTSINQSANMLTNEYCMQVAHRAKTSNAT